MARSIAALFPLPAPAESAPESEAEPELEAEPEPTPSLEPKPEFDPERQEEPESEAGTEPTPEPEVRLEPEAEPSPEQPTEPEAESEPLSEAPSQPTPEVGPIPDLDGGPDLGLELVPDAEPEPAPRSEPGPDPDLGPSPASRRGASLNPLFNAAAGVADAPGAHRPRLVERLMGMVEEVMGPGAVPSAGDVVDLARAVLLLGRRGMKEQDTLLMDLATGLTDERVCSQLAAWIGTWEDPAERDEVIELAAILPECLAVSLVEELTQDALARSGRRATVEALIRFGPRGQSQVERLLGDSRWFVIRNGLTVLAGWHDPDTLDLVVPVLSHEDGRVRREAVVSLGRMSMAEAHVYVVPMIEDPDPLVRAAAARALGTIGSPAGVHRLMGRLEEEPESDVETEIVWALGQIGDPAAVPLLEKRAVNSLFNRPRREIRVSAYHALAAIGTPHALTLLEAAELDRDPEVRKTATELLAKREEASARRRAEASGEDAVALGPESEVSGDPST
jgi:HEAT repeat protein